MVEGGRVGGVFGGAVCSGGGGEGGRTGFRHSQGGELGVGEGGGVVFWGARGDRQLAHLTASAHGPQSAKSPLPTHT